MSLSLVTGYAGTAHVTSAEDGCRNAGIFGEGTYILNKGQKLAATATSANTITIADGDIVMQGRHICIAAGTSETVTISNGISGMNRHDLIVLRYRKNTSTGVETAEFAVIQGTSTSGTAGDPTYTAGDILNGATVSEVPVYRVKLNGINIEDVETLVDVQTNLDTARNHIANKSNPHTVTKSQVGLGNVPNVTTNNQTPTYTAASSTTALSSGETLSTAFGKIAKAVSSLISHIANKSNPHGVTKSQLGLGNVDNTSDKNKPVSTAQQTALDVLQLQIDEIGEITLVDGNAVNVSSQKGSTATTIANITLPKGVYDILCSVNFANNGTGYRRIALLKNQNTIGTNLGVTNLTIPVTGITTSMQLHSIITVTTETTFYLNAQQNSESVISTTGQIKAVKLA